MTLLRFPAASCAWATSERTGAWGTRKASGRVTSIRRVQPERQRERVLAPVVVRRDRARARGERRQCPVDRDGSGGLHLLPVGIAGNEREPVAPVRNGDVLPVERAQAGLEEALEDRR